MTTQEVWDVREPRRVPAGHPAQVKGLPRNNCLGIRCVPGQGGDTARAEDPKRRKISCRASDILPGVSRRAQEAGRRGRLE